MSNPPDNADANTIRILGFAGSLRSKSYNGALVRVAVEMAPSDVQIDIFDLDQIPVYDRDVEREGDPGPVKDFKQAIDSGDALLVATPGTRSTRISTSWTRGPGKASRSSWCIYAPGRFT